MVGSDVWVDYFGTSVCYLKRSWSVKLALHMWCVCVFFFRAVEMGSEMSQTVRFNILEVIDR